MDQRPEEDLPVPLKREWHTTNLPRSIPITMETAGPRACLRPKYCIRNLRLKGLYALEEYYARDLKAY